VRGDQGQQQGRDQQHVDDVQPGDDDVPGVRPAEQEVRPVGADDRDGLEHPLGDPQPGPGQQVVGERVTEQPFQQAEREHHDPDQPVQLARLTVGGREEDPEHVHEDRRHEQQRGPVVDLPHQQPAAHIEADVQRGGVGLAHPHAAQRRVHAVVDDLTHARLEEQGQEGAGQQQDDERVEGDLTEQERPVIGVELAQERGRHPRRPQPVIEEPAGALERLFGLALGHPRSQKLGPTGSW